MRAILFPGQGSQYVGMGSDFYNRFTEYLSNYYPIYRSNFDILSKHLINIVSK